ENTIHRFARIHEAACSFCGEGRGLFGGGKRSSGLWHGPFAELASAVAAARHTKQPDVRGCNVCTRALARISDYAKTARAPQRKVIGAHKAGAVDLARWAEQRALGCSLSLVWVPRGRAVLDGSGRIVFPPAEEEAGLYRLAAQYPDGRLAN